MLNVVDIEYIRRKHYIEGWSIRKISRQLEVSRPTIRISVTGLGYGAANTKLVFRRGTVADSLATSRIGRIRRIR